VRPPYPSPPKSNFSFVGASGSRLITAAANRFAIVRKQTLQTDRFSDDGAKSSHRQVSLHFRQIEVLGRAGVDDQAAVHDVHLVGEFAAEVEILLD
jgi:hypothetical protein